MLGSGGLTNNSVSSTFEVDSSCRLIPLSSKSNVSGRLTSSDSIIGNGIFGIGLGYSLKTTDNLV